LAFWFVSVRTETKKGVSQDTQIKGKVLGESSKAKKFHEKRCAYNFLNARKLLVIAA
jgi:hypothetical protein